MFKTLEQQLEDKGFQLRKEGTISFHPQINEITGEIEYSVSENLIGHILRESIGITWKYFSKGSYDNPRKSSLHDLLPEDIFIHLGSMREDRGGTIGENNLHPCYQEYKIYVRNFKGRR